MPIFLMQILISLFLFTSVFMLVWSLFRFPVTAEPAEHRRLALAVGAGKRQTLYEHKSIAPLMGILLDLARRLQFPTLRRYTLENLDASGNPNNYSIDEYLALCLASGVGLGIGGGFLVLLLGGGGGPFLMALLLGIVGFVVPLWMVHEAATKRIQRISKQLPYSLDLIALMMEAGSNFPEAIDTLIRDDPEQDFNQELRIVQAEIEFGATRAAALSNMGKRIPLDSLRSIVSAVNQAEALGTPLATILKAQSGMMRMYRSVRAEKLSASASVRILLPSMVILLAVVLLIFGPMLVKLIEAMLSGQRVSVFG